MLVDLDQRRCYRPHLRVEGILSGSGEFALSDACWVCPIEISDWPDGAVRQSLQGFSSDSDGVSDQHQNGGLVRGRKHSPPQI